MLSFECDYNTGAHPLILEALVRTNMEPCPGYGKDKFTEGAREKIRAACGREDADVRFLTGGTQTNRIVIDSMLHNYEGVIAATTGHISAHEAGAIEASGHKVLTVPGYDGKLKASDVDALIKGFYADGAHGTLYKRLKLSILDFSTGIKKISILNLSKSDLVIRRDIRNCSLVLLK